MALPTQIDPRKLALKGRSLEGTVAVDNLPRLALSVSAICNPLQAWVKFELDEFNTVIVQGRLLVAVELVCQRCLDRLRTEIGAEFAVQVVCSEEQFGCVGAEYEPWLVVDKTANFVELLEDEVLLALPVVTYHPEGECTGDAMIGSATHEVISDNRFNVLKQLRG